MGYYMTQDDTHFSIDKRDFDKVLAAIKRIPFHASWGRDTGNVNDLKTAFQCWRWSVSFNDTGNIYDISFCGEKLGDDSALFEAIAPYVDSGSYIEMRGEDGAIWRWAFNNGVCKEVVPRIIWLEA